MPTYQYTCTSPECGNDFELVQSFTDPAASTCPVCGQPVRKVFGSVGVVFKGSGFYRTDSRAAASSSDGKSEGKAPREKKPAGDQPPASEKKPVASGAGTPAKAAASS